MRSIPIPNQSEGSSAPTRWRLDPTDSKAEFRVPHFWGLWTVKGHFARLDGWVSVDGTGACQMALDIDPASVHTGNPMRDRHLRAADFFDAERHPEVRFRSTRVDDAGDDDVRVAGELAAAGRCVALDVCPSIERCGDELRIDATTLIDQRELGMTWSPLGMTRAPVRLHVQARLRREP